MRRPIPSVRRAERGVRVRSSYAHVQDLTKLDGALSDSMIPNFKTFVIANNRFSCGNNCPLGVI